MRTFDTYESGLTGAVVFAGMAATYMEADIYKVPSKDNGLWNIQKISDVSIAGKLLQFVYDDAGTIRRGCRYV